MVYIQLYNSPIFFIYFIGLICSIISIFITWLYINMNISINNNITTISLYIGVFQNVYFLIVTCIAICLNFIGIIRSKSILNSYTTWMYRIGGIISFSIIILFGIYWNEYRLSYSSSTVSNYASDNHIDSNSIYAVNTGDMPGYSFCAISYLMYLCGVFMSITCTCCCSNSIDEDTFELFKNKQNAPNTDIDVHEFETVDHDTQKLKEKEEEWIKMMMQRQLYKMSQKNEIKKQQNLNHYKNNPKFADDIIEDDIETEEEISERKVPSRIFPPLNKRMYGGLGNKRKT